MQMNNSDFIMYENFDLSSISPIECGGVVKRYFVIYNKKGLKSVFKLIQENSWTYYVVGACTKILFKDNISFDSLLDKVKIYSNGKLSKKLISSLSSQNTTILVK